MTESNNDARKVEVADISFIMGTTAGRNFVARVLKSTGINEATYVRDNPEETIRRSIRRDFGVQLARDIKEAAPGEYITLLKEMNDDF